MIGLFGYTSPLLLTASTFLLGNNKKLLQFADLHLNQKNNLMMHQLIFAQMHTVSTSILDNPIWHALTTNNSHLSAGNESVKYMDPEVGLFAAMLEINTDGLLHLAEIVEPLRKIILFVPEVLEIPYCWEIKLHRGLLQMIYTSKTVDFEDTKDIRALSTNDVPQMLGLTKLTNPGPFFLRTIELGNYEGIFNGEQLIAMAGQRLRPGPYTEISAVCTDPEFLGKGYASMLIKSQIKTILERQQIPFLHLFPENKRALAVYEKLGFSVRKELQVYFLERK